MMTHAVYGVLLLSVALAQCTPQNHKASVPNTSATIHEPKSRQSGTPETLVPATDALGALLHAVDTDGDKRITRLDGPHLSFEVPLANGGSVLISGMTPLANLVQELKLQEGSVQPQISLKRIYENPVDRLSRQIRERYWHGLTRTIDGETLAMVLGDQKIQGHRAPASAYGSQLSNCTTSHQPSLVPRFLYVPASDAASFAYYAAQAQSLPWLVVCPLPETVTPEWVRELSGGASGLHRHGLLALAQSDGRPVPYVVPGGRFNELYGWDSYFHVLGLLQDGYPDLAEAILENFAYEIEHYGQVLNANRTYYLTRSQPPFFSSMLKKVWSAKGRQLGHSWLRRMLNTAIDEYEQVWTHGARRTSVCRGDTCLSRYYGSGLGQPPEVEAGHFSWLYAQRAAALKIPPEKYAAAYQERTLAKADLAELDDFFTHDRCMRESGHDTTYRWFDVESAEDRCADFATVDLNSLLLKFELDIAALIKTEAGGAFESDCTSGNCRQTTEVWCERAKQRIGLMRERFWDEEQALFFDFNVKTQKRSHYISATSIYPLWAIADNVCGVQLFHERATQDRMVQAVLRNLEQAGGLAATAEKSALPVQFALSKQLGEAPNHLQRQWDYPNGWAPHQVLAWGALSRNGYESEANRLIWRWLSMIVENARSYHGTVPEKFDVVRRSHLVYAEYGNVGTDFAYITEEGFGWMNASVQVGLASLPSELRQRLRQFAAEEVAMPPLPE